jgi:hypothetical protein
MAQIRLLEAERTRSATMGIMLAFVIDQRIQGAFSLVGLLLGVLGSLYLTYELLGRANGPLRWMLRVLTPSLIGAVILGGAGILEYVYFYSDHPNRILLGGILYALVGVQIGTFNGVLVDPPMLIRKPVVFSPRGFIAGLVTAFWVWAIADYLFLKDLRSALVEGAILGCVGGVAGSIWGFINRNASGPVENPALFSWRGFVIGLVSAAILGFASALLFNLAFAVPPQNSLAGAIRAGLLIAPAGGVTGGLSRYIFWRIQLLPATTLGALGVMLTLLGFVAQLVQPTMQTLGIIVR